MEDHIGEIRRSCERRCCGRGAGERVWERGVGLNAQQESRRQHEVVAALKSGKEAALAFEQVEAVEEVERAACSRSDGIGSGPGRRSPAIADVSADIKSGPIKLVRNSWRRLCRQLTAWIISSGRSADDGRQNCESQPKRRRLRCSNPS